MPERFFPDEMVVEILQDWASNIFDEYDLADIYGCTPQTILAVVKGTGAYSPDRMDYDASSKYSTNDRIGFINAIWDARDAGFSDKQIAEMMEWTESTIKYWGGPLAGSREKALESKGLET